jgi:hypothetical protein
MWQAQPVTDAPIIVPIESMSRDRYGAVAYFVVGNRDPEKPDIENRAFQCPTCARRLEGRVDSR